jgi:hypothetical protein
MLMLSIVSSCAVTAFKVESEKKDTNKFLIFDNSPPSDPEVTAPEEVKVRKWFRIYVMSVDPDGDNIYYRYQYEYDLTPSEWWGPWTSGEEQYVLVQIFETGEYPMKWQAKDEHGAESDWVHIVLSVTKQRSFNLLISQLLSRFPLFEKLL